MLPNLNIPPIQIGPLTLNIFGILVLVAVFVGARIALRRGKDVGVASPALSGVLLWGTVVGFLCAHLYNAVMYEWDRVVADPIHLLEFWKGVSSTGGIMGAIGAGFLYLRARHPRVRYLPLLDVYLYGFTFAWIIGRLACTIVFDHPGRETDFFLGMAFQGTGRGADGEWAISPGVRHNIGMYEMLFTIGLAAVMFAVRKARRFPGFFSCLFLIPYALYRFPADTLRVGEGTVAGLSGGQWASLLFLTLGVAIWARRRNDPPFERLDDTFD